MDTKTFLFNSSAKYRAGGQFKWKPDLILTDQQIAVDNKTSHFQALFQDVFADCQNSSLTGDVEMANKAWNIWKSAPFDWWQCQLNFTLWCATAGCCKLKTPSLRVYIWFHLYYTTRRILEELRISLPGDESHSWYRRTRTLGPTSGFALSSLCHQIQTGGQDQDQDSLLVKRRNDNHSPGPVIRELVPSSHQRSELSNTILCIFSG